MRRTMMAALAAAVSIAVAMPAQAQNQGFYVGANVGMTATKTDTSLDVPTVGTLLSIQGLGSAAGAIGLHGGYDVRIGQFVVGVFGDYQWHNGKIDISIPLAAVNVANLTFDTQWSVGGRAGIVFGQTLVYGLVAYTKLDSSDLSLLNATLVAAVPAFTGWSVGGGLETEIAPNIRIGAEYRYTKFDRADIPLGPGGFLTMGLQPETHSAMARVSYAFPIPGLAAAAR